MTETVSNSEYIACDCGTHILAVQSEVYLYDDGKKHHQDFYLAMFSYGVCPNKPSFWRRIGLAWKMLTKGTIHKDSLVMNSDEAMKLSRFITDNLYKNER